MYRVRRIQHLLLVRLIIVRRLAPVCVEAAGVRSVVAPPDETTPPISARRRRRSLPTTGLSVSSYLVTLRPFTSLSSTRCPASNAGVVCELNKEDARIVVDGGS